MHAHLQITSHATIFPPILQVEEDAHHALFQIVCSTFSISQKPIYERKDHPWFLFNCYGDTNQFFGIMCFVSGNFSI